MFIALNILPHSVEKSFQKTVSKLPGPVVEGLGEKVDLGLTITAAAAM